MSYCQFNKKCVKAKNTKKSNFPDTSLANFCKENKPSTSRYSFCQPTSH